jgi:hypothetical protein
MKCRCIALNHDHARGECQRPGTVGYTKICVECQYWSRK